MVLLHNILFNEYVHLIKVKFVDMLWLFLISCVHFGHIASHCSWNMYMISFTRITSVNIVLFPECSITRRLALREKKPTDRDYISKRNYFSLPFFQIAITIHTGGYWHWSYPESWGLKHICSLNTSITDYINHDNGWFRRSAVRSLAGQGAGCGLDVSIHT